MIISNLADFFEDIAKVTSPLMLLAISYSATQVHVAGGANEAL
jgi:hypothetical protein